MNSEAFINFIGTLMDHYQWLIYTAIVLNSALLVLVLHKIVEKEKAKGQE